MTKSTARKVWERACFLLENGWANCADARDRSGHKVSPYSKAAVRFSPWGAFLRAAREIMGETDKQRDYVASFEGEFKTYLILIGIYRQRCPEVVAILKELAREC